MKMLGKKLIKIIVVFAVSFILFSKPSQAQVNEGNVITDEGAWCWFADPRALHYENEEGTINSTYIGYIDVHGNIKATQHNFLSGVTNEVLIRSYFQPDDHNNPSFLILPDERVMIFYSRHTDEACFYYRISTKPGDITALGDEVRLNTQYNTTYPSPFILSDDPDHIYLCWRGINWHPTIGRLTMPDENDQASFDWGPYQMVQSTAARPYCKYDSNGKDKINLTYTLGHPDNEFPNYVFYSYVDVNTKQLKDIAGNTMSTIANGPMGVNQTSFPTSYPNAVVDSPSNKRDWVWQTATDTDGNPVIAMVQISYDKSSHDYYYAKWTGSDWRKTFLANGGGHFHQTPGLELCYSGGMAIDDIAPNTVYCSQPVNGISGETYELFKYTLADGVVSSSEQITSNSNLNNIRPYVVTNAGDSPLKLTWMHGNYYDWIVSSSRPQGYPTGINSDYELYTGTIDLANGLLLSESFDGTVTGTATTKDGVLVVTEDTEATLSVETSSSFSVSLSPYLYSESYKGKILHIGTLEYGLDELNTKTYLTIDGQTYNSSNLLGTSDVWQTTNRGTGGQWYTPTKLEYFNLTLTYFDDVLTIFRNGLIDQVIEVEGLTLSEIGLGGFNGWIEDCHIYNRDLNQEEVRELTQTSLSYVLDGDMLTGIELEALSVPSGVNTDIVLPVTTSSGNNITWSSSNTSVLSNSGIVHFPNSITSVTLTATINGVSKQFDVEVSPRDIENNLLLNYTFETEDEYTQNATRFVKDQSGNGLDAAVYGSAQINGALDLTSNTSYGFSTNGYALAPEGILKDIRSFSFLVTLTPDSLNNLPRIFDFGSASANSYFLRANGFSAGYKYDGNSTTLINASQGLTIGSEAKVAMTFDAQTKTTKIYLNGVLVANSTAISYEPYELSHIGTDDRNYIGRTQWWDTGVANDNVDFKGTIDDVYVYNIALTSDEITALQNDNSTSINKIDAGDYKVFPNPVSCNSAVNVDYTSERGNEKEMKLEVANMKGDLVNSYLTDSFPFVMEGISTAGIYFVSLFSDKKIIAKQKLVVL